MNHVFDKGLILRGHKHKWIISFLWDHGENPRYGWMDRPSSLPKNINPFSPNFSEMMIMRRCGIFLVTWIMMIIITDILNLGNVEKFNFCVSLMVYLVCGLSGSNLFYPEILCRLKELTDRYRLNCDVSLKITLFRRMCVSILWKWNMKGVGKWTDR